MNPFATFLADVRLAPQEPGAAAQPICVIVIDDVGWDLLEATNTPFLDYWRHSTSARTYTFAASPNCSCTRAMVESGFYAIRERNLVGGIFKDGVDYSLPIGPHLLAKRVPASSQVGKWHLCDPNYISHRQAAGYKVFGGSQQNLGPVGGYFNWQGVVGTEHDVEVAQIDEYATDWVTRRAKTEIAMWANFVHVAYNAPHKPHHTPPGMTESGPGPMLEYLDRCLRELVPFALQKGYAVILYSDNGGTKDDGGKGNLSYKAISTPFICDGFRRPLLERRIVDCTDIHATVVDCAMGAPPPDDCDGISLLSGDRVVGFSDRFHLVGHPPGNGWQELATDGRLKLIRRPASGEVYATDWYDEPTAQDVSHLVTALDERRDALEG